ncbi:hypothetical protein [Sporosarcina sp. FSL W7-1283]|uniref:hypothetical protein n=1 Tax=Sporosarcina sp. FSL W7-1283 TaxID=2921560 RepID=UPI0030F9FA38
MTFIYLVVALIINLTDKTPQFVEGLNICFNSNMTGTSLFWIGLLVAVVLEAVT